MIKSIIFPKENDQRYWPNHYMFFANLLKAGGIKLIDKEIAGSQDSFSVKVNKLDILITFGDHLRVLDNINNFDIVLRYHYWKDRHFQKHMYPITPISFHDWRQYERLKRRIKYKANNDIILNNQEPKAAALERRDKVQEMLAKKYREKADFSITKQDVWWNKINNCLVSVCVPGARPNILDRGQLQQWAFGCCTISPELKATLPGYIIPDPLKHYIPCNDDYSDLIYKIEWCKNNRQECVEIGQNAKKLFEDNCTPIKVVSWISDIIDKHKAGGK